MSDVVIRADGLGKKYLLGRRSAERQQYTALRDVISHSLKGIGRSVLDMVKGRTIISGSSEVEEFWALKDISFDIKRGEVVGIIGRNGAGKSTLLKILSRITEPSEGRVEIKGRIASLLEVGTGFHPELSGRENIYLNGAILGMNRAEIREKFDEIVDFAGVEKFLDTPVKRYSSGMYVRLAFAVAAHLEPEILVVDEVLAVGDAEFQKKCIGKMQDVADGGRTVLFVSHNMGAVSTLCQRGQLMSGGRLVFQGSASEVVSRYSSEGVASSGEIEFLSKISSAAFRFVELRLVSIHGKISSNLDVREPFDIQIRFFVAAEIPDLEVSLRVVNGAGIPIFSSNRSRYLNSKISAGMHFCSVQIPPETLMPGRYTLTVGGFRLNGEVFELREACLAFEIEETGSHMARYSARASEVGVVLVHFPWLTIPA